MVEIRKNMGMGQFPGSLNKASVRPRMGQMRQSMPQMQPQIRAMPMQMSARANMQMPNPQQMRQMPMQMRPPMKPQSAQSNGAMEEYADLKVWYDRVSNCVNGYNKTANQVLSSSIANDPNEMANLTAWRSNVEKCAQNYNAARNQVLSKFGQNAVTAPAMNPQNVRRF